MKSIKSPGSRAGKQRRLTVLRNEFDAWILLLPTVFAMYLLIWRPTIMGAVWSFCKMQAYNVVGFCGFDNYIKVITNTQFLPTLLNTIEYVVWSLVLGFLPPVLIAVLLNEMVHFNKSLRIAIYLPAVIPGIAAMLMWYYIFYPDQTGLLNILLAKFGIAPYQWLNDPKFSILGIVIYSTWKGFPGTMLLYYAAVQDVSAELYEAALIDGAGILKRAWHVTKPHLSGILLLNFVNQIISVFQIMEQPLAMTGGGPHGSSTSLGFQLYQYGFNSAGRGTGQSMALSMIMFLILMIFTIFYFRIDKRVEEKY